MFGVVLRGVFSPDVLAGIGDCLNAGKDELPRTQLPEQYKLDLRGMCLDLAAPDLSDYLEHSAVFRRTLGGVPGAEELFARVVELLKIVAGTRELRLVHSADGRPYQSMTMRRIRPGGRLPPHWENEHVTRPSYSHLRTLFDGNMISVLCPVVTPDAGGDVVIYDAPWSSESPPRKPSPEQLAQLGRLLLPVRVGDLAVFDSGRFCHTVTTVEGSRERWTLGGFTGLSPDRRVAYYWS